MTPIREYYNTMMAISQEVKASHFDMIASLRELGEILGKRTESKLMMVAVAPTIQTEGRDKDSLNDDESCGIYLLKSISLRDGNDARLGALEVTQKAVEKARNFLLENEGSQCMPFGRLQYDAISIEVESDLPGYYGYSLAFSFTNSL